MYKLVFFKVKTKVEGKKARVPDVPQEAFNNCHCAWTDCTGKETYTFAIVDDKININKLSVDLKVKGLTKEEEEKYKSHIEIAQNEVDYLNGTKERPVSEVSNGI